MVVIGSCCGDWGSKSGIRLHRFLIISFSSKGFNMGKVVGGVTFYSEANSEQTIYSDFVIRLQSYGHSY